MQPPPDHQPAVGALLLFTAVTMLLGGAGLKSDPALLKTGQQIESADALLRSQGWTADGAPYLDSFDRELSGNGLSSLRSCSGTGAGYCRYDYRRGREHLEVITVPSRDGDGLVHHWRLDRLEAAHPASRP